ncbi:MAG: glycosyltransferase family 2 protein [Bacteroides sp.]|nr:glycosyltransferase family 2 protein [Bacteroides sp.]
MVTVIIPIYNAEEFLPEAIASVLAQTYTDWELILVNDGSTDRSAAICDAAARECRKIKVVHNSNRGVSNARNTGLDLASGEYIVFIDADDMIPPYAIEVMLKTAIDNKAEIVCGEIKEFHGKNPSFPISDAHRHPHHRHPNFTVKLITGKTAAADSLYQKNVDNSVWGKLFTSRLWKSLRFKEGMRYEDLEICYRVFLEANMIVLLPQPIYWYRQHAGSYLHTFSVHRADALKVTDSIIEYVSTHCPDLLPAARSRRLSASFNILGLIAANPGNRSSVTDRIADDCWEKIKELRGESLRNPNVRLKNKIGIMVSYIMGRKGLELLSKIVYRN